MARHVETKIVFDAKRFGEFMVNREAATRARLYRTWRIGRLTVTWRKR